MAERFFSNYQGNVMPHHHPVLDAFFPEMASILGTFLFDEDGELIRFDWHSYESQTAFAAFDPDKPVKLLYNLHYPVEGKEFKHYVAIHSFLFFAMKSAAKDIGSAYLERDLSTFKVRRIIVSQSSASLDFLFEKDGELVPFSLSGEAYASLMDNLKAQSAQTGQPSLIETIVSIARARVEAKGDFFKNAIWIE